MAERTLYLLPDTNVFVQCKSLDQVDWREIGDFDEIVLVVCRPIQDEIDDQKGRGAGRVTTRARATASVFRDMLKTGADNIVRETSPRVRLTMALMIKPTPGLGGLDYEETDDALVGCAHAFAGANPDADVRVLTDDGGPMGAAKSVGVSFIDVPESWLLAPEPSPIDKKLAAAEAENARLRKTEPEIVVRVLDVDGAELTQLEVTRKSYSAMPKEQIQALMHKLKLAHPMATDFGPTEKQTRKLPGPMGDIVGMSEVYEPASTADVSDYQSKQYPGWLSTCEYTLHHLHFALQEKDTVPLVVFEATNIGTRPANSVMIEIGAEGAFAVMPPPRCDDDELIQKVVRPIALPAPPEPPRGKWSQTLTGLGGYDAMAAMRAAAFGRDPITSIMPRNWVDPSRFISPKRDPNDFYYKERPSEPRESFALTCEQWRHACEPEKFAVEIHVDEDLKKNGGGLLSFRVHADNLSAPLPMNLPVKITVQSADIAATAEAMIDQLTPRIRMPKQS